MNKSLQIVISTSLLFALIALFWINSNAASGQTSDSLAYLPRIQLDPTLTPTITPTPTASPTPSCNYTIIESADIDIENAVEEAIQNARKDAGSPELNRPDNLSHAARIHSQDMADNNFVGHQGSDSSYGPARLSRVCYDVEKDQEIVWGGTYTDTATLITLWLANENWGPALLDDEMKDLGVGYIKGPGGSNPGEGNGDDDGVNGPSDGPYADYLTLSFGRPKETRRNGTPAVTCEIPLENEFGRGVLITSNPEICFEGSEE